MKRTATAAAVAIGLFLGGLVLVRAEQKQSAPAPEKPRLRIGPNVLVSWAGDGGQAELMVDVNPMDKMNLFGAGTHYRANHPLGGQVDRGYYSQDGGSTWNTVRFPEELGAGGGDPQAAFGRTGTAYFSTLSFGPKPGAIHFYRSEDGGMTWDKPADLGAAYDHDQIAVDRTSGRFAGRIYVGVLYGHGAVSHRIGVFRSNDDGRTWSGPVEVASNLGREHVILNQLNPLVFTDGGVFFPFIDSPLAGLMGIRSGTYVSYKNHYWFATSQDGGATFDPPRSFELQGGGAIEGPIGHFPMLAIDNSDGPLRDRIYISWAEWLGPDAGGKGRSRKARLFISHSSDRGKVWSRPKALDIQLDGRFVAGIAHQPLQALAVNDDGTLVVTWYDTRDTAAGSDSLRLARYITASVDGGETFLAPARLSSASWDAAETENAAPETMVSGTSVTIGTNAGLPGHGDYLKVATAPDGTFHAFWEDARTGSHQIWTARIRLERESPAGAYEHEEPDLVQTDVTDRIEAVLDPLREHPPVGTIEIPIRLKNVSHHPIHGPLTVEVTRLAPDGAILSSQNGKSGVGAQLDYSKAFGDFETLEPGAVSEAVVWRFRAPADASGLPTLHFQVTGRVERAK